MINLYGFGGAISPYPRRASHCFALNGDIFNPRVAGVEGVMHSYRHTLNNGRLYGPTHFSEVIREVANHAESDVATS